MAKRLKPLQGRKGGVLGGKALVALELRRGVAVAMATDADGETNDAKLVPALLPQVREHVAGVRLWVADRQFCDLTQTAAFTRGRIIFSCAIIPRPPSVPMRRGPRSRGQDAQGRGWVEDWGWLGCEQAKQRRFVRRITLFRPGEETIILLTDLLDAVQFPANDLLALYLARWSIERVFQQITEVFHLQTLIGTTPQGTVFQCAFCLLLYNMVQVVRAYVATAQARPVETLSTELLFDDVHRQLVAVTELVPAAQLEPLFVSVPSAEALREQLTRCWLVCGRPAGSRLQRRNVKCPRHERRFAAIRPPSSGSQAYNKQRVNNIFLTTFTAVPWSIVTWMMHYHWNNAALPVLWAAWKIIGFNLLAASVSRLRWRCKSQTLRGTLGHSRLQQWGTTEQLRANGLLGREGVYVGMWPVDGRMAPLVDTGLEPTLIVGPTGSGKDVGIVIPNGLTWPHSLFVLDPKREAWEQTAGWRAQQGHGVSPLTLLTRLACGQCR